MKAEKGHKRANSGGVFSDFRRKTGEKLSLQPGKAEKSFGIIVKLPVFDGNFEGFQWKSEATAGLERKKAAKEVHSVSSVEIGTSAEAEYRSVPRYNVAAELQTAQSSLRSYSSLGFPSKVLRMKYSFRPKLDWKAKPKAETRSGKPTFQLDLSGLKRKGGDERGTRRKAEYVALSKKKSKAKLSAAEFMSKFASISFWK